MKYLSKYLSVFLALLFLFSFSSCKSTSSGQAAKIEPELQDISKPLESQNIEELLEQPEMESAVPEEVPEILPEEVPPEIAESMAPEIEEISEELPGDIEEIPEEITEEAAEIPSEIPEELEEELPAETGESMAPEIEEIPEEVPAEVTVEVPPEIPPPLREPPSPPPFLGPAERETPPGREETPVDRIGDLPQIPIRPLSESSDENPVFSRVVRLLAGQYLEIPFRGTGWVYLGELGNRRGMSYESRRLDIEAGIAIGQSFIFRAESAGSYILKFYRQDFIQDYIINDYVQVIVGEGGSTGSGLYTDSGRIVAEPRWPPVSGPFAEERPSSAGEAESALQPAPVEAEPDQAERAETAVQMAESTPAAAQTTAEMQTPDDFLKRAKEEFDGGRVEQAVAIMNQMSQRFPSETDEVLWLYGQLYEASSPLRDIRLALYYYRRLVSEYPQSSRYDDARGRIIYLERFYFNIR